MSKFSKLKGSIEKGLAKLNTIGSLTRTMWPLYLWVSNSSFGYTFEVI